MTNNNNNIIDHFPEEFTYLETGSRIQYEPEPPGVLNAGRLAQGKPAFGRYTGKDLKKRVLVIHDSFVSNWFQEDSPAGISFRQFFARVCQIFHVYQWQDGAPIKVVESSCWDQHEMRAGRPDRMQLPSVFQRPFRPIDKETIVKHFLNQGPGVEEKQLAFKDVLVLTRAFFTKYNREHFNSHLPYLEGQTASIEEIKASNISFRHIRDEILEHLNDYQRMPYRAETEENNPAWLDEMQKVFAEKIPLVCQETHEEKVELTESEEPSLFSGLVTIDEEHPLTKEVCDELKARRQVITSLHVNETTHPEVLTCIIDFFPASDLEKLIIEDLPENNRALPVGYLLDMLNRMPKLKKLIIRGIEFDDLVFYRKQKRNDNVEDKEKYRAAIRKLDLRYLKCIVFDRVDVSGRSQRKLSKVISILLESAHSLEVFKLHFNSSQLFAQLMLTDLFSTKRRALNFHLHRLRTLELHMLDCDFVHDIVLSASKLCELVLDRVAMIKPDWRRGVQFPNIQRLELSPQKYIHNDHYVGLMDTVLVNTKALTNIKFSQASLYFISKPLQDILKINPELLRVVQIDDKLLAREHSLSSYCACAPNQVNIVGRADTQFFRARSVNIDAYTLKLNVGADRLTEADEYLPAKQFTHPLLERLVISGADWSSTDIGWVRTYLKLMCAHIPSVFKKLQELEIHHMYGSVNDIVELLSFMPNIKRIMVNVDFSFKDEIDDDEAKVDALIANMPMLYDLRCVEIGGDNLPQAFKQVICDMLNRVAPGLSLASEQNGLIFREPNNNRPMIGYPLLARTMTTMCSVPEVAKRIFFTRGNTLAIHPSSYRLVPYGKVEVSYDDMHEQTTVTEIRLRYSKNLSHLLETADVATSYDHIFQNGSDTDIFAVYDLTLTHTWQRLPSCYAREKLKRIAVAGLQENDFEVAYDLDHYFYYIRLCDVAAKPFATSVRYRLDVSEVNREDVIYWQAMSNELRNLIQQCYDLSKSSGIGGDVETIAKLCTCLKYHGAPFKPLLITNECGHFIEFPYGDKLVKVGFRHYCRSIQIDESANPFVDLPALAVATNDEPEAENEEAAGQVESDASTTDLSDEAVTEPPEAAEPVNPYLHLFEVQDDTQYEDAEALAKAMIDDPDNSKFLLENKSEQLCESTILALISYAKESGRPCYYLDKPDDYLCSNQSLAITPDGVVQVDHPLAEFLRQNYIPTNPPIIIMNQNTNEADDVPRLNTVLDDDQRIDGIAVPPNTQIVSVQNIKDPKQYRGPDFLTRFNVSLESPLTEEYLASEHDRHRYAEPFADQDDVIGIECYNSADWHTLLFGHWELNAGLSFVEGPLLPALRAKKSIHLRNAPWHEREFRMMWQQAKAQGYMVFHHEEIRFEDDFVLYESDGDIEFDDVDQWISITEGVNDSSESISLNPTNFYEFFHDYGLTGKGLIETRIGHIAFHATKYSDPSTRPALRVALTRELTQYEWGQLLKQLREFGVALDVIKPSALIVPFSYAKEDSKQDGSGESKQEPVDPPNIIISNDVRASVEQLAQQADHTIVINITELNIKDLFFNYRQKKELSYFGHYYFEQVFGCLCDGSVESDTHTASERGIPHDVILYGELNSSQADILLPWLWQHPHIKLVCSSDPYLGAAHVQTIEITKEEKKELLKHHFDERSVDALECDKDESYNRMYTRLSHPDRDPWLGLESIRQDFSNINVDDLSLASSNLFKQQRLDAVLAVLNQSPFVILTGLTGVGKTSFVHKELMTDPEDDVVITGIEKLEEWVHADNTGRKYLFIDEANLCQKDFAQFEDLKNRPPSIIIKGKRYVLSDDHKVVFAGNPTDYGVGREMPTLFSEHGGAVVFDPLPAAYIYHEILRPILALKFNDQKSELIAREIFKLYHYLLSKSQTLLLITSRELQTIVTLVIAKHRPLKNILQLTHDCAYAVAKMLVPSVDEFNTWAADADNWGYQSEARPQVKMPRNNQRYVLTESRREVYEQLDNMLALRRFKQVQAARYDEETVARLCKGDINGVVLEGESGIGKSEFVLLQLQVLGFTEGNSHDDHGGENVFYKIPASMALDVKQELLQKAFHEGAVVIMDEMNSCAFLEQELNDLLMGQYQGERARHPGFLLIGTQNPKTYDGRRVASNAMNRRVLTCKMSDYTRAEKMIILQVAESLSEEDAELMVTAYHQKKAGLSRKQSNHFNFRTLIQKARNLLRGQYRDVAWKIKEAFEQNKIPTELDKLREIASRFPDTYRRQWQRQKEYAQEHQDEVIKRFVLIDYIGAEAHRPILGKTVNFFRLHWHRQHTTKVREVMRETDYTLDQIWDRVKDDIELNHQSSLFARYQFYRLMEHIERCTSEDAVELGDRRSSARFEVVS